MFHPYATWTPEDHAAWYQAKLANFREKWRALRKDGTTRLMAREQLLRWTRDSLAALRAPVPTRPYRGGCPCHMRPRRVKEEWKPMKDGLDYIHTFRPAR
jgi:hypothetical protein